MALRKQESIFSLSVLRRSSTSEDGPLHGRFIYPPNRRTERLKTCNTDPKKWLRFSEKPFETAILLVRCGSLKAEGFGDGCTTEHDPPNSARIFYDTYYLVRFATNKSTLYFPNLSTASCYVLSVIPASSNERFNKSDRFSLEAQYLRYSMSSLSA
jgi:hypothetical protein